MDKTKFRIVTEVCDYCRKFESKKEFEVALTVEEANLLARVGKKIGIESVSCVVGDRKDS